MPQLFLALDEGVNLEDLVDNLVPDFLLSLDARDALEDPPFVDLKRVVLDEVGH